MSEVKRYWVVRCPDNPERSMKLTDEEVAFLRSIGKEVDLPRFRMPRDCGFTSEEVKRMNDFENKVYN